MTFALSLLSCAICFAAGAVICITPAIHEYVEYQKQHAHHVSESELFANQVFQRAIR